EERARTLLAVIGLQAESVKASFFSSSIVFTKVNGNIPLGFMDLYYSLDIENVTASGLNLLSGQQKGVSTLADSLVFNNFSFSSPFLDSTGVNGAIKKIAMSGIQLDLRAFLDSLKSLQSENPQSTAELLNIVEKTFRVERVAYEDYTVTMDTPLGAFVGHVDAAEVKDMKLLRCGPMSMDNMTVRAMETEILSLSRVETTKMSIPNFLALFSGNSLPDNLSKEDVLKMLKETPFVLEGFRMRSMKVRPPYGEPLSMEGLSLDISLAAAAAGLNLTVDGLSLPPMGELGLLLSLVGLEDKETLLLFGNMQGALKFEEGGAGLALSGAVEEKSLGGIAWNGDFSLGKGADILEVLDRMDLKAHSLVMSVTDYGLMQHSADFIFQTSQKNGDLSEDIKSPEDVLMLMAKELEKQLKQFPFGKAASDLASTLEAFARESGSLVFSLRAEPPLDMKNLDFDDPGLLSGKGVIFTLEHKKP
ncbi:MAG: hypothetical protein LBJ82_02065, partial [Deltaproteobacteria bacterium]|nr:hypothetical protein [Deltaproteobacteria bacterium]